MVDGGGCEPYEMDFGDRAIVEWLVANLTLPELARREALLDAVIRWNGPVMSRLWRVRRLLAWPFTRRLWRRIAAIDAVAEERGGPRPAEPAWKVRHEFGVPRDG